MKVLKEPKTILKRINPKPSLKMLVLFARVRRNFVVPTCKQNHVLPCACKRNKNETIHALIMKITIIGIKRAFIITKSPNVDSLFFFIYVYINT